jgi:DNA-binding XRE family transcriptional regulator
MYNKRIRPKRVKKPTTPFNTLKAYRQLNNFAQIDMAKLIDVSTPTYNQKENGKVPFLLLEARTISQFFGKSIEDIFFADGVK